MAVKKRPARTTYKKTPARRRTTARKQKGFAGWWKRMTSM